DVASGRVLHALRGAQPAAYDATFAPDGRTALLRSVRLDAGSDLDPTIMAEFEAAARVTATVRYFAALFSAWLRRSPDGAATDWFAAASGRSRGALAGEPLERGTFSADGARLFTREGDTVHVWSARTGAREQSIVVTTTRALTSDAAATADGAT